MGKLRKGIVMKQYSIGLTSKYLDMKLKRITKAEWLKDSKELLEAFAREDSSDVLMLLFKVQFLMTIQKTEKAKEVLRQCDLLLHSNRKAEYLAYYLYLSVIVNDNIYALQELRALKQRNSQIWQIDWLLYYVDETLNSNLKKYIHLKQMFLKGCRSPLLYLEVADLLCLDPELLIDFSEFEEKSILFLLKNMELPEKLYLSLVETLARKQVHSFSYSYYQCLKFLYEKKQDKFMLAQLVRYLTQTKAKLRNATTWFQKAIEADLFEEGLYESYLHLLLKQLSLDGKMEIEEKPEIPRVMVEYFAKARINGEEERSYLYAYVYKFKEKYSDCYASYETFILPFILEQLKQGNMNKGLALLYSEFLESTMVEESEQEQFLKICFMKRLRLAAKSGKLILKYHNIKTEVFTEIQDYVAVLPIFSNQYDLYLEEESGKRSLVQASETESFLTTHKFTEYLEKIGRNHLYYRIHQMEKRDLDQIDETDIVSISELMFEEEIEEAYKKQLAEAILPALDLEGRGAEVEKILVSLYQKEERKELESQLWETAYAEDKIGAYGVGYLLEHFNGSLLQRVRLFQKARTYELDLYRYAYALLKEMMVQEQYLTGAEEMCSYILESGNDDGMVGLYLQKLCVDYYIKAMELEPSMSAFIATVDWDGLELPIEMKLLMLRTYAIRNQALDKSYLQAWLEELLFADIYLPWMQAFQDQAAVLHHKQGVEVVEYHAKSDAPLWIKYTRHDSFSEEQVTHSELMKCHGEYLHTKQFLLFFGEYLQYEIYGLEGVEQNLLSRGSLQGSSSSEQIGGSYEALNSMLIHSQRMQKKELIHELESYMKKENYLDILFEFKKS